MFLASPETERKMREYSRQVSTINSASSLVAFLPTIFTIYSGIPFQYFFILVPLQILVISGISYLKYGVERKAKKIEVTPGKYVLDNTMSYAIFSISFPILLFLFILFNSLTSLQRVITINLLLVMGLFLLISNLPASRMKRISMPLEDAYLAEKAEELSKKLGTGKLGIYVLNLGTFKIANAGQVGARKYSVFITDYLLDNLSPEENVAVIAHEFAHARQKHVLKTAIIAWAITSASVNLMVFPVDVGSYPALAVVLPAMGFILLMLAMLFLIPAIKRRFESQADLIAASVVNGMDLVNALQKITRLNFAPSEISRHWSLDHPPTRERVKRIIAQTRGKEVPANVQSITVTHNIPK